MSKLYLSRTWLRLRYVVQGKDINEIAKECSVSTQTIYRYLVEYGLIKAPRKWTK